VIRPPPKNARHKPALRSVSAKVESAERVLTVIELNPDEKKTVELDRIETKVLREIIADRLWWDQALARAGRFGVAAASIVAFLATLAAAWPWITSIAQSLIKDAPR